MDKNSFNRTTFSHVCFSILFQCVVDKKMQMYMFLCHKHLLYGLNITQFSSTTPHFNCKYMPLPVYLPEADCTISVPNSQLDPTSQLIPPSLTNNFLHKFSTEYFPPRTVPSKNVFKHKRFLSENSPKNVPNFQIRYLYSSELQKAI